MAAACIALGACGGSSSSSSNGESSKSAQQIVTDAGQATGSASSAHISGRLSSQGQAIDLDVVDGQTSGGGTVTLNGTTFKVVLVGQEVYLNADAATWTKLANGTAAQLLAGRWVKTSATNANFSSFAQLLELPKLVSSLQSSGTLSKEHPATVDGQKVVPVKDNGPNQGTLDVAATGRPYIVAVEGGGSNSGTVHFDRYDTASLPGAPANAIDLSSLQGG